MKFIPIILVILMFIYPITMSAHTILAQEQHEQYSETLHIYQIYDKTIIMGIFSGNRIKQLLPTTFVQGLQYFSISVAKYTPDTANVYWFINDNPERENAPYLYWRGIQVNVTYQTNNYDSNALINWLSDNFQTVFQGLSSTSKSRIFYSSGNLDTFSKLLIDSTIDQDTQGFLNLFRKHTISYVEYRFSNGENKLIIVTVINIPQSIIPRNIGLVSVLNYTKILNTELQSSPFSNDSLIIFHLYGLSVNKSDVNYAQNINWVSGPNNHWTTTGFYKVPPNTMIQKMNIYVTLFNQPLIFYLIPSISYLLDDETVQITVNVTNPNQTTINNVTVNLMIPKGFMETPSTTVYIGDIKPNSTISKKVLLHYVHSEENILRIRSMYSYYDGITMVQGYANDVIISTEFAHFPSIVYYVKPLTATLQIDGNSTVTYEVNIHNIGNDDAKNVMLHMGTYHINLGQINKNESRVYKIRYDPKNVTFSQIIPFRSDATPPIYVTFTYNNLSFTLLSNTTLPSLARVFSNYQIFIGIFVSKSILFTSTYAAMWNITNIGGLKTIPIILNKTWLSEIGFTHNKLDDFSETPKYLIVNRSVLFNRSIVISLSLTATRNDTFILPPLFQNISGLPPIMMEPAILTNAIYIIKNVSKSSLNIGDMLDIIISIQNLGSKPIFSIIINDTLPQGWELIEGKLKSNISRIDAHSTYVLKYSARALDPQSQILPSLDVQFSVNNFNLKYTSKQIIVHVTLLINLNIVAWNNEPLKSGFLMIKDSVNKNITKMSISDGKVTWNGYVGNFNIQIIYRNTTVYNGSISITRNNSTLTLKTSVYPFIIRTVDLFNNLINSEIYVYSNKTLFGKDNNSVNILLPSGSYNILIKSNGKIFSMPLDVVGPSNKTIDIQFNVIQIGNISIDVPILMLMITILFVIIIAFILKNITT
ncbi:MAG: hypothetical protein ACP5OK_04375 [Thermoprotei archaeon]